MAAPPVNTALCRDVESPPIATIKARFAALRPPHGRAFDMTQAVPSFPTFQGIRDGLVDDLRDVRTGFYTENFGLPALRALIAQRHPLSAAFDGKQVMVTAGANHAAYTALTTFFSPGNEVALLEPYYFNHVMAVQMMGLKPVNIALSPDNGFALKADRVIRTLEQHPGVRGVIVITPNNPTGACYDAAEIAALLEWTATRGIEVILDETYARFDPAHLAHPALGSWVGRGLTLVGSFSKVFSLTGYRVGYLVSSTTTLREAQKVQDTLIICAPHLGQRAAIHGLLRCDEDAQREIDRMNALGQTLVAARSSFQRLHFTSVGAFFAYLHHPFVGVPALDAALRLFEATGVMSLPGTVFGPSQDAYLRLAYCNLSAADLDDVLLAFQELDARQ